MFTMDPEWVHERSIRAAEMIGSVPMLRSAIAATTHVENAALHVDIGDLHFRNPIGVAAGLDKNGRATPLLAALGFGHVEIGSISASPSAGNPKPRLFRIPQDHGIVVNYGLPNDGALAVAKRLARVHLPIPLGVNIVNTNRGAANASETEEDVFNDYVDATRILQDRADYLCMNLSCPNTLDAPGFFAEPRRVARLLHALGTIPVEKPLWLKVAPFVGIGELDAFLEAVDPFDFVTGFAINLPPGKPMPLRTRDEVLADMPGAVAGRPSTSIMDNALRNLYARMDRRRYRIIASGGVWSAEDAYRKIRLGASLVQLYTVLIYEGPWIVRHMLHRLASLLRRDGFRDVIDAVGTLHRPVVAW